MRNLKIFFISLIFMFSNIGLAFSDVTASVPTNLISNIASATSFSSTEQISPEAASEIQETTSSIVDGDALTKDVQESAEAFGEAINEASSKGEDQTEKFAVLGSTKNKYEDRRDLQPTLGTIIYDTGLRDMTREGGHYDNDNKNPDGGDKQIFDSTPGAQQARVLVYVDFNRKILFGSVENRITLKDGTKMSAVFSGSSTAISKGTLPVDKRLSYTMSSATGLPLAEDEEPTVANDQQPYFPEKVDAFENSLLDANGNRNEYLDGNNSAQGKLDQADMQKSLSHGTGGDKDVAVLARFKTAGDSATPGISLAAIEAYNGDPCASATACTSAEIIEFKDGIERYSFEVETKAIKYTGDLPQ